MQMQILETMNLVINLEVAAVVTGVSHNFFLIEKSHWILGCIRVGCILPVRVCHIISLVNQVLIVTACNCILVTFTKDRLCWIHRQSSTDSTACICIAILLIHELTCDVEVQVLVEQ